MISELEPYLNKIHNIDCIELMAKLPDNCIDMILTDPPWGISSEVVITRGRNKMKFKGPNLVLDFGKWNHFEDLDDYLKFTFKWVDEAVRILRPGGIFIIYFDRDKINFLSFYLQHKYAFKAKGYYAHLKSNPVPQARRVKWMNGWEELGMWQKPGGKLTYNYQLGQEKDYSIHPIVGHTTKEDGERIHTTQKPLKIAMKFIVYWSNKGDIIFDPFTGSGAFLLACEKLERNWIGSEIDKTYCDAANKRIEEFRKSQKAQMKLEI